MPVLILSEVEDFHIPFVARHLSEPPLIIDTKGIIDIAVKLTYEFDGNQLHIIHNGKKLSNVTGVWHRRPIVLDRHLHLPIPEQYQEYSASAIKRFMHTLYCCFPEALWVSDYFAIQRAENKPYQQMVAANVGFHVPKTTYTTDS